MKKAKRDMKNAKVILKKARVETWGRPREDMKKSQGILE